MPNGLFDVSNCISKSVITASTFILSIRTLYYFLRMMSAPLRPYIAETTPIKIA
uniref:Uncharacterized protein n=1 Tax=uncultured marine virus TaxID=186617 RepID=A0A0F7LAH2_9VIRU|nr:hypothetical protein [uncultured marine virus]